MASYKALPYLFLSLQEKLLLSYQEFHSQNLEVPYNIYKQVLTLKFDFKLLTKSTTIKVLAISNYNPYPLYLFQQTP